jgi:hypothetical protein
MASSSAHPQYHLGAPPSDKLTRNNYPGWRAQVLPPIRGARLVGLLTGTAAEPPEVLETKPADKAADKPAETTPNPAYDDWIASD